MKYKITDISEEDYGCEGIPDGKEPECIVTAENEINDRKVIKLTDSFLTENNLNIGSYIDEKYFQ